MTETNLTRASQRAASVRTALTLAGAALVFFIGIILAQGFGSSMIGLGALGIALIGFPLTALAGRIRK